MCTTGLLICITEIMKWLTSFKFTVCYVKSCIILFKRTCAVKVRACYIVKSENTLWKEKCVGRESNPGQLLGRQLCSPLYHRRLFQSCSLSQFIQINKDFYGIASVYDRSGYSLPLLRISETLSSFKGIVDCKSSRRSQWSLWRSL